MERVRAALVSWALVWGATACAGDPATVPDATAEVVDAAPGEDASRCDEAVADAQPVVLDRRCEGGERVDCDGLYPPACDAYGCCPVVVQVDERTCCRIPIAINPADSPCCTAETLLDPEVCARCTVNEPP